MSTWDERLGTLVRTDARRLRRRSGVGSSDEREAELLAAEATVAARQASVPVITYPDLPVSERRDDILEALREHQVVVLAGETGSGKTTQLPKMLLEAGRGVRGLIGHTQPRRIAARAVAERVAEELGSQVGELVGYKVRFTDQVGPTSLIKVLTDGMLLAEITNDRDLLQYDVLIVDEAHERSLTIDFLLGYLTGLLKRRPDLQLVITSATIDPGRFAAHFARDGVAAPVIEVSGRTFPVEIRYRPPEDDTDQTQAICDAVDEVCGLGPGDVLVFLSGEREIRDAADALKVSRPEAEVVPLFARLSAEEQHRVFAPHNGRRVVLATNVAETSLTVPGIRYVVDPGTARISRYSTRTKVQRLPIEKVSQASATQRSGRCGRVAAGVAIRLYSEQDFTDRPAFTDPEILRTNLASVILQMTYLELGQVETFPFLDPPDARAIRDGVQLLEELNALTDGRLTKTGRQLSQLPVDPRLARMVVEGDRNGCLEEILVLVAGLTVQDPRERPMDKQPQAQQLHARFADPTSDFVSMLNLWDHVRENQQALGSSAFRRMCRTEMLNYLRIREWQDLHSQLRRAAGHLKLARGQREGRANADAIHQSLLPGLLSQFGMRDGDSRDLVGARGTRFVIAPGTPLARKPPKWVMVAELVETNRLYGRTAARIEPEWAEKAGSHLVLRTYSEPRWSRQRASVVASERVTLYGLPLVARRSVAFGGIEPLVSRELFLHHALVLGEWDATHRFLAANRQTVEEVAALQEKVRRTDLVVDDEALLAFYSARVPVDVVSGAHFDRWWKEARQKDADLLTLTREEATASMTGVGAGDYPDSWRVPEAGQPDLVLPLSYRFDPGNPADGVSVTVPLSLLPRVRAEVFDWQVRGFRHELVTALLRSLPKNLRVALGPAPDAATAVLALLAPGSEPLLPALARELRHVADVVVPPGAFSWDAVQPHLRMNYRVVADRAPGGRRGRGGRREDEVLGESRDLAVLRGRLTKRVEQAVAAVAPVQERRGITSWDLGVLQAEVRSGRVVAYPTLVDAGDSVTLKAVATAEEAERLLWGGVRRLLLLQAASPFRAATEGLTTQQKLSLASAPQGGIKPLVDDIATAVVDALMVTGGGAVRDAAGFTSLLTHVRARLAPDTADALKQVSTVLATLQDVRARLQALGQPVSRGAVVDVTAQVTALTEGTFVARAGVDRLPDLVRYLTAAKRRLEKLPHEAGRDALLQARVHASADEVLALLSAPDRERLLWMVQELRVSLFGSGLPTRVPVSEQRITKAVAEARSGPR